MRDRNKLDEFVLEEIGPQGLVAVFEQDDATGYLYLTEANYKVRHALHVYNREKLSVREQDVRVIWSATGLRCGVVIGGKLRAVIGANGDLYRPPMTSMHSTPVEKEEWLEGFQLP